MSVIECVPNLSEGRRPELLARYAAAARETPGVYLLDASADASHNRSVLTLAGHAVPLGDAVLALVEAAIETIDLRTHRGEHPRVGAVDVIPFIPLGATPMAVCTALAEVTGSKIAERFGLPVFLYERAARLPERRRLEDIRRGQFEGLVAKMAQPEWIPDFGPTSPHPTAGAVIVGARPFLIAWNVNLATDRLDVAKAIAARVRERGGGLPCVKAIGVSLIDRGIVQVSMNLTDFSQTPIQAVVDRVTAEAAQRGVSVVESELIGLIPAAALAGTTPEALKLRNFTENKIIENRLRTSGLWD